MESNSVCNHTSDKQNCTTAWRESDLLNHEYDYRPNWTTRSSVTNKLIITTTKFVIFLAFLNQSTRNSESFLLAVKKKRHVLSNYLGMMYNVLLHCPISAEISTINSQNSQYNKFSKFSNLIGSQLLIANQI